MGQEQSKGKLESAISVANNFCNFFEQSKLPCAKLLQFALSWGSSVLSMEKGEFIVSKDSGFL